MNKRVWPFTMDYGLPMNWCVLPRGYCSAAGLALQSWGRRPPGCRAGWPHTSALGRPVLGPAPTRRRPCPTTDMCSLAAQKQFCNPTERYKGVWEVPVWQLTALGGPYTLGPGDGG